jgi:hypothetical protein
VYQKMSLTAWFLGSKFRKIISEKSKIYNTSQNTSKIKTTLNYLKREPNHVKFVEKCIIYSQLRDLSILIFCSSQKKSKIHRSIDKNFFGPKQTNAYLMILYDKLYCQISRILMNPRPIHVKTLRE